MGQKEECSDVMSSLDEMEAREYVVGPLCDSVDASMEIGNTWVAVTCPPPLG